MKKIYNKELIAFQSVDEEGDIWCNEALLFKNEEEVELFFNNPKKVIEILKLELNEEEDINNFITIYRTGENINSVYIDLEYCGEKRIVRMNKGFVIKNK